MIADGEWPLNVGEASKKKEWRASEFRTEVPFQYNHYDMEVFCLSMYSVYMYKMLF